MNAWDWILLAAVLVGAGFALVHLLKSKKNGVQLLHPAAAALVLL